MAAATKSSTVWEFAEKVMGAKSARTLYVWGPPGSGKTYTACRSGLNGRSVYVITLTPETPAAELRGFWMPHGDQFVWQDGVFIQAMREGARVVINEVAHASHDVLAILYPILEGKETARLTLPTGETVEPADGFQVICTDNMAPSQLSEALKDRFNSVLHITEPHPDAIAALDEGLRHSAVSTFSIDDGRGLSLRAWRSVQELSKDIGEEDAYKAVFGAERGEQLLTAIRIDSAKA